MSKIICCLWASFALAETATPKVVNILFLGKTQTGKSALVDIFYNHIMGKKYEDTRESL